VEWLHKVLFGKKNNFVCNSCLYVCGKMEYEDVLCNMSEAIAEGLEKE